MGFLRKNNFLLKTTGMRKVETGGKNPCFSGFHLLIEKSGIGFLGGSRTFQVQH